MSRRSRYGYALAALVYVALRLRGFLPVSPLAFPDTGTYLHTASAAFPSDEWFAGWRPFTLPLLYRLLPGSDSARIAGQFVISVVCWLALAVAVARSMKRLPLLGFCLVLAVSLSVWIIQWDAVLLSESVSISLAALLVAAWLELVQLQGRWTVGAVLLVTLLWTFARDTNAFVVLMTVPLAAVWAIRAAHRRALVVLSLGLVAISVASFVSVSAASNPWARWRQPLLNVIGARVLTNRTELAYFRGHRMPLPSVVDAAAGTGLGEGLLAQSSPTFSEPRVAPFLHWVWRSGRQTLASFLLTHPFRTVAPVLSDAFHVLDPRPLEGYRSPGTVAVLPAPLGAALYPPSVVALLVVLGIVLCCCGYVVARGHASRAWLVPGVGLLLMFPTAVIIWNGDSLEVPRHELLVGIVTRLSLLMLSVYLLDGFADRRFGSQAPTG